MMEMGIKVYTADDWGKAGRFRPELYTYMNPFIAPLTAWVVPSVLVWGGAVNVEKFAFLLGSGPWRDGNGQMG